MLKNRQKKSVSRLEVSFVRLPRWLEVVSQVLGSLVRQLKQGKRRAAIEITFSISQCKQYLPISERESFVNASSRFK